MVVKLIDYKLLKLEYYSLFNSKKVDKGNIRAFIGLKSWLHERERLRAGDDKILAHITSLECAISDFKGVLKKNRFWEEFNADRKVWLNESGGLQREAGGKVILPPPIPNMRKWRGNGLTLVSLFSGAFGLDLGFLAAGFDLRVANDIDEHSHNTVTTNLDGVQFVHEDFAKVSTKELLERAGLGVGELDVLTGGPPCQPFSTAGKRLGLNDPRASPLREFVRAIKEVRPRAFVMEEVTGLKSARLKHVPISERHDRKLEPEERKGSAFNVILEMLKSTGYKFKYNILNAADYGAPQVRNRLIFIGLREGEPSLPLQTHSDKSQATLDDKELLPWNTLWDATADIQGGQHEFMKLSKSRVKYMKYIPPGGHWRHLPEAEIEAAMGGAYASGGGKMGYFRRLAWSEPSPTVVTSPIQNSTMFCHPEEMRPISVEEYKRIQGFPDDWVITGNTNIKYRLIGDAVPVHLSYATAKKVSELLGER